MAVLPGFLAETDPALHRVPSDMDTVQDDLWLVTHSDLSQSARVRAVAAFIDTAVNAAGLGLQC